MGSSIEHKITILKTKLSDSLTVADLQWSLMVAALSSYKHDTVLRPFPPMFITEQQDSPHYDNRDFKSLEREVDKIPCLQNILTSNFRGLSDQHVDLLDWCLNRTNYTLKHCNREMFKNIQKKTGQNTSTPSPNYIFEIIATAENEEKFQKKRNDRKLFYGYHGSSIENFHSIVNYGLQSHRSKNALFGEGTYLSSELAISLQYSPGGRGWEHSALGDRLSCIAVCEMIDDDLSVKCQVKEASNGMRRTPSRAKIEGSEGGEIPETYYVVRNNEVIRVKYLLVYAEKTKRRTHSWFHRHKFQIFVCFYGLLLLLVSLYSSKSFRFYYRKYISSQR